MHTNNRLKKVIGLTCPVIGLITLLAAGQALAEQFEPEGIRDGSLIYYPFFDIAISHDDNVLSQEANEISSAITTIGAGIRVQILSDNNKSFYDLELEVETATVKDSRDDDYTDGGFTAGYTHQPNDKLSLTASAALSRNHDDRTSLTQDPDEFEDTALEGEWYYGLNNWEGADTLINFTRTDRVYKNNLAANQAKDRQHDVISGLLRFPLAPNTRLRLSLRQSNFDYEASDTRDSSQLRILAGVEWQASELTQVSLDLGQQNKAFDQSSSLDVTNNAWEMGITLGLEEHNTISLSASSDFDELSAGAGFIEVESFDLLWRYGWDDELTMLIAMGTSDETSVSTGSTTLDQTQSVSLSIEYVLRSTTRFNIGLSSVDVESEISGGSSEKAVFSAGLTAAF